MIPDHLLAGKKSKEFCDFLFSKLKELIPNLQRKQSKEWCGFYEQGRSQFAFINHRKRLCRIEVWCLGDPVNLKRSNKLCVEERKPSTGGFARLYQARFFIDDPSQIDEAVQILYGVSYPIS